MNFFNFFGRSKKQSEKEVKEPLIVATQEENFDEFSDGEFADEFADEMDDEMDDEAAAEAQEQLLEQFRQSPEGRTRLEAEPEMGFWVEQFLAYSWDYLGIEPSELSADNVEHIVSEIFPRKISLYEPEQADDAIPELTAFWQFMRRQYKLTQAKAIILYLQRIQPQFRRWMTDPRKAGMAKSLLLQGQAAGFDMTNEGDAQKFLATYNAKILAQPPSFADDEDDDDDDRYLPGFMDTARHGTSGNRKVKAAKKKARKMEKASRRANRKKRK